MAPDLYPWPALNSWRRSCVMRSVYLTFNPSKFGCRSIETTAGCGTLEVLLTNTTNGSPQLDWDMGNGDQLVGEAVAYTYDQPGSYTMLFRS